MDATDIFSDEWRVEIDGTNTGRGPRIVVVDSVYQGLSRAIAELETTETRESLARNPRARWKKSPNYAEVVAVARLFVSAPKLLKALEEIQLAWSEGEIECATPAAKDLIEAAMVNVQKLVRFCNDNTIVLAKAKRLSPPHPFPPYRGRDTKGRQ